MIRTLMKNSEIVIPCSLHNTYGRIDSYFVNSQTLNLHHWHQEEWSMQASVRRLRMASLNTLQRTITPYVCCRYTPPSGTRVLALSHTYACDSTYIYMHLQSSIPVIDTVSRSFVVMKTRACPVPFLLSPACMMLFLVHSSALTRHSHCSALRHGRTPAGHGTILYGCANGHSAEVWQRVHLGPEGAAVHVPCPCLEALAWDPSLTSPVPNLMASVCQTLHL